MEFDDAKENIQPLACGRNASILHASITHTSRELNEQRRELEANIYAYNGDDPLEPWCSYISWIEQTFPSGGKESGLQEVLRKCLHRLQSEERYYQDRRMIKLFIKFLYASKEPLECFQQLFSGGVGTMVADFYIAWAYCYDSVDNMKKADEIFRRGIECRAEPLDELKEAYLHFKSVIAERFLYKDDNDALQQTNRQLEERRLALSSLRGYGKRKIQIGSIRTGAAIKSELPGVVQHQTIKKNTTNACVDVLKDENFNPNSLAEQDAAADAVTNEEPTPSNIIGSIVDKIRHQENEHEPGPWNKVHDKQNAKKLVRQKKIAHTIGFSIHEDMDIDNADDDAEVKIASTFKISLPEADQRFDKPFKYTENFVNKNRPQAEWVLPITTDDKPDAGSLPRYAKYMIYPRPNREFQMEEYLGYCYYKKRGIENAFSKRYAAVWSVNDINASVRVYPNFARKSNPQILDAIDQFEERPHIEGLEQPTKRMYDVEAQEEFQLEELMAREWFNRKNQTVMEPLDMDMTNCASSSNNEQIQRRKSFFPQRRSLAIRKIIAEAGESASVEVLMEEAKQTNVQTEKVQMEDENKQTCEEILPHTAVVGKPPNASKSEENPTQQHNFKVPSLPIVKAQPTITENSMNSNTVEPMSVKNKLPFEIFVEDTPATAVVVPRTAASSAAGSFDPEETCSTQIFNICLKSQSASTPKVEQKIQKRQFNVLREVEVPAVAGASIVTDSTSPTVPDQQTARCLMSPLSPASVCTPPDSGGDSPNLGTDAMATNNSYSPRIRKQLSTILETSEHGTQSSTATTKSSSLHGHQVSDIAELTEAPTNTTHTTTTTIVSSNVVQNENPEAQGISKLINDMHIDAAAPSSEIIKVNVNSTKSPASFKIHTTLNATTSFTLDEIHQRKADEVEVSHCRDQMQPSGLKFTIFQDPTKTIPNVMLKNAGSTYENNLSCNDAAAASAPATVAGKFERMFKTADDSTMHNFIARVNSNANHQDKTETITKIGTVNGVYFPEDKTETLTTNLLARPPPVPMITPQQQAQDKKSPFCYEDDYETLEFFRTSPKKFPNSAASKQNLIRNQNTLTPLSGQVAIKKFCMENTPTDLKEYRNFNNFTNAAPNTSNINKNLLDTFINDFSLPPKKVAATSAKLHDSFVPEFSFIEDTQPSSNGVCVAGGDNADLIIAETHPESVEKSITEKLMFDTSVIAETQELPENPTVSKGAIPKQLQLSKIDDDSLLASPEKAQHKPNINQTPKHLSNTNKSVTPMVDTLLETFSNTKHLNLSQKIEESFFKQPPQQATTKSRESLIPRFVSANKKSPTGIVKMLENPNQNTNSKKSFNFLTPNKLPQVSLWPQNAAADGGGGGGGGGVGQNFGIFELMGDGDTFANGINFLKNSTMLSSNTPLRQSKPTQAINVRQSIIQEPSFHIKNEMATTFEISQKHSPVKPTNSVSVGQNFSKTNLTENDEMSIYYTHTPKVIAADDDEDAKNCSWSNNDTDYVEFVQQEVDLNETVQLIEKKFVDPNLNPFDADLINAFLDNVDFVGFLKSLSNTMLVGNVPRLRQNLQVQINDINFKITKLLGQGNYGTVFCGIDTATEKQFALKQERPANYWEYYICLEVQERIKNDDILLSYMKVDYAQIGNNASIFVSHFAPYGSIITVCNKIKKVTNKTVDEYVVMHLTCELLEIIDHLHAADIIHADLKADNFLFMNKLSYNSKRTALHLIDFGVSIDMRQFKPMQAFNYVHNDDAFKCVEMREGNSWTYQLDLYGLAGVVHVLLFGKYMMIEKKKCIWLPKQHMPRYINRQLWEHIFRTLLNVRDCRTMPNLQELRQMLKQEMAEKERFVITKINEFNNALDA